jgi:hypothetical protein
MTTLSDIETRVRRALRDPLKVRVDTGTYDGSSNPISLGKDLAVATGSETLSVGGVVKTRGTNYTIDYESNQITVVDPLGIAPWTAGAALRASYKESQYRSELIWESIEDGRKALPVTKIYKRDAATITLRNLVRDFDLASTDVNEPALRAIFAQGTPAFRILGAEYQPNGSTDQLWVPFGRWQLIGETTIHLFYLLPSGYTLRFRVIHNFTPLIDAGGNPLLNQATDIPDVAIPAVVLWATASLSLKSEPARVRLDTANAQQGQYASPVGAQAQTSEDFQARWDKFIDSIRMPPQVYDKKDVPQDWEIALGRYR